MRYLQKVSPKNNGGGVGWGGGGGGGGGALAGSFWSSGP